MTFSVQSEVGQLRQAIIHRPGLELSRLTPQNIGDLLFDDVLWAKKAKEEHDVFAEILRDQGVQVHYFEQLLAEALELAPFGKFLYSSDAFGLPELYYLGAVLFRRALSDFLTAGLEEDLYSERTVVRLARMLCADNAKRAYGLGDQM